MITKQCQFCTNNVRHIDYKDIETLKKHVDLHSRIANHRRSGVCSYHQKKLATAIKHARFLALVPFMTR